MTFRSLSTAKADSTADPGDVLLLPSVSRKFGLWIGICAALLSAPAAQQGRAAGFAERITFASADGHTKLIGYLFKPEPAPADPIAAVVMMHGRGGAYSTRAKGIYNASTLSRQHLMWGQLWAERGYIALLVDGFGPRGFPQGFPLDSYRSRPHELNEVTIRPLDACGALAYLRSRLDVVTDRVGLQGWSNGGSATLATMSVDAPGIPTTSTGFRAALVFYPGCGLKNRFENGYRPYAAVRIFQGTADEEVSPRRCQTLVEKSRMMGGDIEIRFYDGATHGFDAPTRRRQSVQANTVAAAEALKSAQHFFASQLQRNPTDDSGNQ